MGVNEIYTLFNLVNTQKYIKGYRCNIYILESEVCKYEF